jgi:hypothetical protein
MSGLVLELFDLDGNYKPHSLLGDEILLEIMAANGGHVEGMPRA